jgi:hypothetical protein
VVGWALDRFAGKRVAACVITLAAFGMTTGLTEHPSLATMMLAVGLVGLSIGAELDLMSFLCARLFGLEHYGAVYRGLAVFFYSGIAAGGLLYGIIHDVTGTYSAGIGMSSALLLVASGLFLKLPQHTGAVVRCDGRRHADSVESGEQSARIIQSIKPRW